VSDREVANELQDENSVIVSNILPDYISGNTAEQGPLDIAPWINGIPVPDGKITAGDYVVLQRKVLGAANF